MAARVQASSRGTAYLNEDLRRSQAHFPPEYFEQDGRFFGCAEILVVVDFRITAARELARHHNPSKIVPSKANDR